MIFYNDLIKKYVIASSVFIFLIVVTHITIASISRNYFYYGLIMMITLAFVSTAIIALLVAYFVQAAKKTNKLYNILYEECDPKRAIIETLKQLENVKSEKNKVTLNTFLVNCYYRNGDVREALNLLKKEIVYKMNVSANAKILWYHNFVMIAAKSFEYDHIKNFQTYLDQMKRIYPRKTALINEFLESENMFIAYCNNEYVKVEKYYNDELNNAKTKCEKVIYNMFLAKIKKSTNSNPVQHIDFVINNGFELCYVKEAKELKERL